MFIATITTLIALLACRAIANNSSTVVIPNVTGPYGITYDEFELVDNGRPDPFNSSHNRRLMISRYTPIPTENCNLTTMLYAPEQVTDVFWAQFGNETISKPDLLLPICTPLSPSSEYATQTPLHNRAEDTTSPVILFSPGYASPRYAYHRTIMQLASQGFTIYSLDHTYETDPVIFPNGDIIRGLRVPLPQPDNNFSTVGMEFGQRVRVDDISFLLDTLGYKHDEKASALVMGHSFGGATALAAVAKDKRVRAGVNLDGTMYAPTMSTPLGSVHEKQAVMLFGSDYPPHWTDYDVSWQEFWNTTRMRGEGVEYAREVNVNDTIHASYCDMAMIFEMVGFPESYKQLLPEHLRSSIRVQEIVGKYVSEFFWWALGVKDMDQILVEEKSEEFPEVWVVNDKADKV